MPDQKEKYHTGQPGLDPKSEDRMRDLVFKNLTSRQKNRKVLSACEVVDNQGMRCSTRRHFVCIIKQVQELPGPEQPQVHILKEHNTLDQRERFSCRIKGRVYVSAYGRLFVVYFMHSLKISLEAVPVVV